MRHWSDNLPISACKQAISWARTQPDLKTAWRECKRDDWMVWLLSYYAGEPGSDARKRLALCLSDCIEATTHLVADDDIQMVIILCLVIVRDWAEGGASDLDDVQAVANTVVCAATRGVYGAAYSVYGVVCGVNAADDAAAYGAYADIAYAAGAYADNAVCADIIREHYPRPPTLRKNQHETLERQSTDQCV